MFVFISLSLKGMWLRSRLPHLYYYPTTDVRCWSPQARACRAWNRKEVCMKYLFLLEIQINEMTWFHARCFWQSQAYFLNIRKSSFMSIGTIFQKICLIYYFKLLVVLMCYGKILWLFRSYFHMSRNYIYGNTGSSQMFWIHRKSVLWEIADFGLMCHHMLM